MTPQRPPTACQHMRCPARVPAGVGGYCPKHRQGRDADDVRRRGSSWARGYNTRHANWRLLVLHRDPWCVRCREQDLWALSTTADHIVPLDPDDPDAGDWSIENGQGLCHTCHIKKTWEDRKNGD